MNLGGHGKSWRIFSEKYGNPGDRCDCRYVQLLIQEMTLKLEIGFVLSLLAAFKFEAPDDSREFELSLQKFLKDVDSTKLSLVSEARQARLQLQEHLYDYIHLSPIKVFTCYFYSPDLLRERTL